MMIRRNKQVSPADKALLTQALPFMWLSRCVYSADMQSPDGWKIIASTDNSMQRVSGFFARVYEKTGVDGQPRYAVAFRGTDNITDINNLLADADIAFRRLPGQYSQGLKFVKDVCRQKNINPADMIFTGHSLGGYLAASVGEALNSKNIWTFNAPAPDARIRNRIKFESSKNPVSTVPGRGWVHIRSAGDLISKWGDYNGATTLNIKTEGSPHGVANLEHAAIQLITGEPIASDSKIKKGFLSRVFNAVAKVAICLAEKLAASRTADRVIGILMGARPQRQSPVLAFS